MDNKLLIRDGFSLINFKLVQSIGLDETILLGYIHSKQLYFCGKNELTKEGYFYQYREDIAKNTSITFKRQKKAFDHLEELGFVVTKIEGLPAKKYFKVIESKVQEFFDNYESKEIDYNDLDRDEQTDPPSKVKNDLPSKDSNDSVNNNKENNNKIKKDISKDISCKETENKCSEILDYLNNKTGKHYRNIESTKRLIRARLREGYSIDDFKTVINKKAKCWSGTEFEKYLRPATLFASSHFDDYLNESECLSQNNYTTKKAKSQKISEIESKLSSESFDPSVDKIFGVI